MKRPPTAGAAREDKEGIILESCAGRRYDEKGWSAIAEGVPALTDLNAFFAMCSVLRHL